MGSALHGLGGIDSLKKELKAAGIGSVGSALHGLGGIDSLKKELKAAGIGSVGSALHDLGVRGDVLDAIINPPPPVSQPRVEPEPPRSEPSPSPHTEVERLEFQQAVLEEELAILSEEPARVAHPDDDWDAWPRSAD